MSRVLQNDQCLEHEPPFEIARGYHVGYLPTLWKGIHSEATAAPTSGHLSSTEMKAVPV